MILLTEVSSGIDDPFSFNHRPQSARSNFYLGPGNTHGAYGEHNLAYQEYVVVYG